MDKQVKVLVVCGGVSTEREVSLRSGKSIFEALVRRGYVNAEFFDLTKNNIAEIINKRPDIVKDLTHCFDCPVIVGTGGNPIYGSRGGNQCHLYE